MRVLSDPEAVRYPTATHAVGLEQDTDSRPALCDPMFGPDATDHRPLAEATINGRLVDGRPASVLPMATQVVGVVQDTPYRKLSTTLGPGEGVDVTDQLPLASVSMSIVPVLMAAVVWRK
jgi:hypothetical protein